MLLADILSRKKSTHAGSPGQASSDTQDLKDRGETVAFEMDLHLPCRVVGIKKNGSRWEGEAMTLSLSSSGVHLLLPPEAELEGEILMVFKIPPPLRSLFVKKRFRMKAEIELSGSAAHGFATMGRKIVFAVFSEPLHFRVHHARNEG